uniref:EGF-like domain-containing protein n=1 Tax=Syphacia muris TaxID=451379 RepID=A0A0N5AS88_9BILA
MMAVNTKITEYVRSHFVIKADSFLGQAEVQWRNYKRVTILFTTCPTILSTILFYNKLIQIMLSQFGNSLPPEYLCSALSFGRCMGVETLCQNGGYPHPRHCDICICPSGFSGTFCEKKA